MAGRYCPICNSFHEPRSSAACRRAAIGRGGGERSRYPRAMAIFFGVICGVMAGAVAGWLANHALPAVIAFVVIAPSAAWWEWPKKGGK